MIVLNSDWEQRILPSALKELVKGVEVSSKSTVDEKGKGKEAEMRLDERKLGYVHFEPGTEPKTHTSITRSISRFLAQNRARNDQSNKQEFLLSLAEKRRKLTEQGEYSSTNPPDSEIPSCARTDAKTQNRDIQMKYDIAKNEDGPLRKTMKQRPKDQEPSPNRVDEGRKETGSHPPTASRYPALDERLKNIETHLAVRYVPSIPYSLLDRLRFLEDHIIHLEKEYPPWAALHFNQPNRGWPPPPR
ncbi:hypothetical protein C8Q75DRAFT_699846, partial [Abortiporus biennis]